MTTVRIHTGKRGTTIRLRAGNGQDLRGVVEALAGQRPAPEKWISHAQWPLSVYRGMDGTGISTDTHDSEEGARAVCDGLRREGFGGQRRHFPIRTWVTRASA
jgi:hypothetical protein